MIQFPSIWGDLQVNSVEPAPKAQPKADETAAKPEQEEKIIPAAEEGAAPPAEEDVTPKAEEEGKDPKDETPIEFTEDDVAKAYTILDEQGVLELTEDDEFDATPSGLADAVAATVRNKLAKEIAAIPPSVQDFYAHVMEGNDPSSFKVRQGPPNWSELDISTEENMELSLREFYKNQGLDQDAINEEIEDHKTTGKLSKKAEIAIAALTTKQESDNAAATAAGAAAATKAEADRVKEVENLKKVIDSAKEIAGFELDDVKRENFKKYLFNVNQRTGKTQMQENMGNEDRRMQIAFLDFVNYTKADLTKEVATSLTKDRNKKLARYSDKNLSNKNSGQTVVTKTNKGTGKIVFPTIFGTQSIETED